MAQVAHDPKLQGYIEDYLDYLTKTWRGIPLDAREWDEWDEDSRLDYVLDWGVPADRLHSMREWAAEGLLTEGQMVRFRALLELVARYQYLVDAMLDDSCPPLTPLLKD